MHKSKSFTLPLRWACLVIHTSCGTRGWRAALHREIWGFWCKFNVSHQCALEPERSSVSWGAQGWREGIAPPCSALVQPHLETWGRFWCLNRRRTSEHESVSRGGQPRWGKAWRARKCQNKRRIMLWFSLWYTDGMELKLSVYSCKHIQELIICSFYLLPGICLQKVNRLG